jgi:hypothetical protein
MGVLLKEHRRDLRTNFLSELVVSMSTLQKRSTTALETYLSILARNAGDLELQLFELNKLRYRVRQAELSARKSRRTDSGISKRLRQGNAAQ